MCDQQALCADLIGRLSILAQIPKRGSACYVVEGDNGLVVVSQVWASGMGRDSDRDGYKEASSQHPRLPATARAGKPGLKR